MFTGMTRGYRAAVIKSLPVYEKGKEFHLEVIHKATALGYVIDEIPCVLEWKDHKLTCDPTKAAKRKSSSKIARLIRTHLFFAFTANPIKLLWGLGLAFVSVGFTFFVWALIRLIIGEVAVFLALTGGSCVTIGLILFLMGVVSSQVSDNSEGSLAAAKLDPGGEICSAPGRTGWRAGQGWGGAESGDRRASGQPVKRRGSAIGNQ